MDRRGFIALGGAAALAPSLARAADARATLVLVDSQGSRGELTFLDLAGRVVRADAESPGSPAVLVSGLKGLPDGVALAGAPARIYWTNMGSTNADDGTVLSCNLDGSDLKTIVPTGGTFTPKQLKVDAAGGKLYWSDREGMKLMRCNLDGSGLETLLVTGDGDADRKDARHWCVGIALDLDRRQVYWTQKGNSDANGGTLRRAGMDIPPGQTPATRTDVQVLFDALPEPIDLDIDPAKRMIYWTDRGDPPRGNTVSRAPMDPPLGFDPKSRKNQEILVTGLKEGIGICLDLAGQRMFFTDLGGTVYRAKLDGSDKTALLTGQGQLTGICYRALAGR